jgi:hypothetical protein
MITQEQLEVKAKEIIFRLLGDGGSLENLSDDELFALVAYELWKDGMDWDQGIPEYAEGKDPIIKNRLTAIQLLKNTFGY